MEKLIEECYSKYGNRAMAGKEKGYYRCCSAEVFCMGASDECFLQHGNVYFPVCRRRTKYEKDKLNCSDL